MRAVHRSTLVLTGLLATLLAPAHAWARELELSGGASTLSAPSSSADAVTTDDLIQLASLRAAVELPELGRGQFVELGWRVGRTQATDFQEIDAELELDELEVALRVERDVRSWVRIFARGGLAVTFARLSLDGGGVVLEDRARAISAIVGLGLDVVVLRAGVLELGVRVDAGFRLSSGLDFAPTPRVAGDDVRIRTQAADLGAMDLSGATGGLSLVGRF